MQKSVILIIVVSFFLLLSCTTKDDSPQYGYIEPEPEPEPDPEPYRIEPNAPENIREVEVTNDTITLAWDEVYNAKSYIVYMDDSWWQWPLEDYQYSYRVHEPTFTITFLQSNNTYFFEVYSSNYSGESWHGAGIACTTEEAYGVVRVYKMWPPTIPGEDNRTWFYVDDWEIGLIFYTHQYEDFPVLTGYRNLKIIESTTNREKGIFIYLTTDGYIWNNRYDYDWKNF